MVWNDVFCNLFTKQTRFHTNYSIAYAKSETSKQPWTKTSKVPARYVHLSGKDTDEALLKHYGIFADNEQRMCPRCGALNQPDALYCMRCSAIISVVEAQRVEEQRTQQEELVAKVVEKLIEQAPDILERALRESGAISETKKPETQKLGQVNEI